MDLVVGREGYDFIEEDLLAHFRRRGVEQPTLAALNPTDRIANFDLLNGAVTFLEHVVEIEGYADIAAGLRDQERGHFRLRHLPVWEELAWAPFELPAPRPLNDDSAFFVGSCPALLRDLADIASRSPVPISVPPPHYERMRSNYLDFIRSQEPLNLSPDEVIRWVWCSLKDGAEIAIRHNAILCATPD